MDTRDAIEIILLILTIFFVLGATAVGRANYLIVNAAAAIATGVTLFVYALN